MGSYKKKLFIVLLLILLLSFFVCSSVNASSNYYVTDTSVLLKNQQEYLATIFLTYLDKLPSNATIKQDFSDYFNGNRNTLYWCYFNYYHSPANNNYFIECYVLPTNIDIYSLPNQDNDYLYFNDTFLDVPYSGFRFDPTDINQSIVPRYYTQTNYSVLRQYYSGDLYIPSCLVYYKNDTLNNYINGIKPNSSPWAMLQNAINNNTEAVEDTTQAVNNLRNDFNEEESSTDYDFPTDNPTTDPTSNGIDTIFNLFYSRINNWAANIINVPIPFTNKSFSISPSITEDIVDGFAQTTQISRSFKYLLGLVWYYLLGRYVVKDVQKYVDGLQTGEILTKSDTNIKTEML